MGTRSAVGIRVNGKDKLMYCLFDGYPTSMGKKVFEDSVSMIESWGWDIIKEMAERLKCVNPKKKFSKQQKEQYGKHLGQVSYGDNMYSLLRGLQGELKETMREGIIAQYNSFINDSLMCEWAYILNVDTKTLEIYEGFQKTRPTKSRYANAKPSSSGYYACELIREIPLGESSEVLYHTINADESYWETLEKGEVEAA